MRAWLRQRQVDARKRVLQAIRDGNHYGLDISRAARLGPGRMYPALHQLLEAGELTDEWIPQPDGRPARRAYRIPR